MKDRLAKKRLNLILAEGIFDFILYIDVRNGTFLRKHQKKNLPYSLPRQGKYDDFLYSLRDRLDGNIEEFSENMKLIRILGTLSVQNRCAVACRMLIEGHIYDKNMLFYYHENKKDIIALCEDVTDLSEDRMWKRIIYLSHEIRTLTGSIYGNLDILRNGGCVPIGGEDNNKYLENAVLSAEYLLQLVNSVLYISEIQNDTDVIKFGETEAVTLEELFKYPKSIFEHTAVEKGVKLQFLFGEPVYQYLYLNRKIIQQIIINLISNAIKYTYNGGNILCRITEEYLEEKRVKLILEVTDTGIGMEEDFLSGVWEDYTRERRKKEAQGSGLGLSLTRQLVELLQGNIKIVSRSGYGTKVLAEFETDGDDVLHDPHCFVKNKEDRMLRGKRIFAKKVLVAEDENAGMEVICKYLEELGIAADKTYDGDEVLEFFEQSGENDYDAILMDINMPGKNAIEVIRTIRNMDRKDSSLPIIAVTADILDRQKEDVLSAGASGYIIKPYCLEDISSMLAKYQG